MCNKMNSEEKIWVWIVGLFVGLIIGTLTIGMYWNTHNTKRFIDGGYTQTTLPGTGCVHWVLPEKGSE